MLIEELWRRREINHGKKVIKYTGENPVACLWDEAKIKKRRKSRFLIYEKFSCTDISYL